MWRGGHASSSKVFSFKSDANSKRHNCKRNVKRFPEIKDELWGGEFWSDGGTIKTVGEGNNGDIVRNYIKKQGRKENQLRLVNFTEP